MIYLGYHWTTDAIAGFALGCLLRIGVTPPLTTALGSLCDPDDSAPPSTRPRLSAVANPADSEMANER
ncbi:hypothetical protein EV385_5158 [Krasilnikovia cinnamomea]|uniref:PAP2 superfamily protein n=1 Tax=Krasilnikovia cinnamomea TaxID=349313 RepID=A0A4Q7ZQ66_9ACTN|nr:hypothetical protein EV385_5158 [Krasilnikovia cinnamomea]